MPIFEYRCRDCGQDVEVLVRRSETPRCPACESIKLEKLMSVSSGHVSGKSLPVMGSNCPPSDAPLCSPRCCRAPS